MTLLVFGSVGKVATNLRFLALKAGNFVRTLEKRQGMQVVYPEEIAFENCGLSRNAMAELAKKHAKNDDGQYLSGLLPQRRLAE